MLLQEHLGPACIETGGGNWVVDGPLQVGNEFERRLAVGGAIAARIREAVYKQLGTCVCVEVVCMCTSGIGNWHHACAYGFMSV